MENNTGRKRLLRTSSLKERNVFKSKLRNSKMSSGVRIGKHGTSKRQKWTKSKLNQRKMKFKSGGNTIDPLNLMGLIENNGSCSPKIETPVSDRSHIFEPDDVVPIDPSDPLKLNNLEDDVLNMKVHAQKKKRKRKRRHTLTETDADTSLDKSLKEDEILVNDSNPVQQESTKMQNKETKVHEMADEKSSQNKNEKLEQISLDTNNVKLQSENKDLSPQKDGQHVNVSNYKVGKDLQKKKNLKYEKKAKGVNDGTETKKENGNIPNCNFREKDNKFKYGNYNRYYGYRNANMSKDDRVELFQREWFDGKACLDIGCNVGHVTLYIARHFNPKSLIGVDIDEKLIGSARKNIRNYLPTKNPQAPLQSEFPISFAICHGPLAAPILPNKEKKSLGFPYNVSFKTENYVDCEISSLVNITPEYDIILCLSVTKWVQLNWGDEGVKKMFKKIFLSLKPDGKLLLEPQPWKSYSKKKNMTPSIRATYGTLKFKPDQFISYLLSEEIGFTKSEMLGVPKHHAQGFQRPMYCLTKGGSTSTEVKMD